MHFTDLSYYIFLIAVLTLYWLVPKSKNNLRKLLFIFCSFAFYSQINLHLCLLLFTTATIDYWVLKVINSQVKRKKAWLTFSILINFLPLLAFKTLPLIDPLLNQAGSTALGIPIGISFYTFKSVACLIDLSRDTERKIPTYIDFLFFLSFFPSLLCGPISRYDDFSTNLKQQTFSLENVYSGLWLISWGLVKKIVIADTLLKTMQVAWNDWNFNFISSSLINLSAAIQLTLDFSAYTDIAIGSALLFGFYLPINFRQSLLSKNIGEFWRNHHITLSEWFRDYVYLPTQYHLVNKKLSSISVLSIATLLTFLLSGVWHGLNFNGIGFGIVQAVAVYYYLRYRHSSAASKLSAKLGPLFFSGISWVATLTFISFSLHLLLSPNWQTLFRVTSGLFKFTFDDLASNGQGIELIYISVLATLYFVYEWFARNHSIAEKLKRSIFSGPLLAIAWSAIIIFSDDIAPFVYYRF